MSILALYEVVVLVCLEGKFKATAEISCVAGATVSYDEDAETVSLEFGCELDVGEVVLSLAYVGCLNDQMRGFYRFKHTIDGEERYGAATQFAVVLFGSMHPQYFSSRDCIN